MGFFLSKRFVYVGVTWAITYSLLFSSLNSIRYVLSQIDYAIQYGEDADVKVRDFDPEGDD